MILGIDAHCIRGSGGSITHLREALRVANPASAGFSRVVVWSGRATLDLLENRPWLEKAHHPALDAGLVRRSLWSATTLSGQARKAGCDVLWSPGCSFAGSFRPYVAMSRNMLPFEWREMWRCGLSPRLAKFLALRFSQGRTYQRANGMIYLSQYARARVGSVVGRPAGDARVIPHGIDPRFSPSPDPESPSDQDLRVRLLYVSAIDVYKHQWIVMEAVAQLQHAGIHAELALVGPIFPQGGARLRRALARFRGTPGSVEVVGAVSHAELPGYYRRADIFVYASSCENLPNILLEAMACGVPIACSSRGPMPEVLQDGGVYFDPEDPATIASAVRRLVESPALRQEKARLALRYSRAYTWSRCAAESFAYLAEVAARYRSSSQTRT